MDNSNGTKELQEKSVNRRITKDVFDKLQAKLSNQNHYTAGGIEPIDFITANGMDFREGNVIKYVTRYKRKNGLEDLIKARVYLDMLITKMQSETTREDRIESASSCIHATVPRTGGKNW